MKNKIEKDSFITEIEEDLKNDNLKKLWDKYGFYLLAAMASILLITIFIEVYSYFSIKNNQEMTTKYSQALTLEATGNNGIAMASFAELAEEGEFLSELAMLEEASILIKEGKNNEAQDKLFTIVDNKNIEASVNNAARIILASLLVDSSNSVEVEKVVRPLLDANNPWRFNAYEFLAASYLNENNKDKAIEIFVMIADNADNPSIKARAFDMLSVLR